MNKSTHTIFLITILLLLNIKAAYSVDYNGRREWMLQPPSARGASMGRAFVGIIDNASTVFWNPGGVAFLKNLNMEYSHIPCIYSRKYFEEYKVYSFSFNANFRKSFVIGLNLQRYFQLNNRQPCFYDKYGSMLYNNLYQDSIIGLLFGYRIWNIGIGINTKFLSSSTRYFSVKNIPMALDIGALYSRNFTLKSNYDINTNLGFSILNISNGVKYKGTIYPEYTEGLPSIVRIGYSTTMKPSQKHWKLTPFTITHNLEYSLIMNANKRRHVDYKSSLGLGFEAVTYEFLYSRFGYYHQKSGKNWSNDKYYNGITYGIGLNLPLYHFVKLLPLSISYDYGKIPTQGIGIIREMNYVKIHSLRINCSF